MKRDEDFEKVLMQLMYDGSKYELTHFHERDGKETFLVSKITRGKERQGWGFNNVVSALLFACSEMHTDAHK